MRGHFLLVLLLSSAVWNVGAWVGHRVCPRHKSALQPRPRWIWSMGSVRTPGRTPVQQARGDPDTSSDELFYPADAQVCGACLRRGHICLTRTASLMCHLSLDLWC